MTTGPNGVRARLWGADNPPLLSVDGATKAFGAVHALEDVSIQLRAGEVHALVGENGAGKSTLVKILAGVHVPDRGAVYVSGREVVLNGPADAREAGVAVIYQEPILFPDLTVEENIFVGRQPLRGRRIDRRAMRQHVLEISDRLGVKLDPGRIARGLSIAEQQIVEIAKALSLEANVIVMDEPTAALSAIEVDRLFRVVESLRAEGAAVLFISHRLEEVFALCSSVTVLRDGRWVMSQVVAGLGPDDLIRAMVGRDLVERDVAARTPRTGPPVLQVERLTREGFFADISFEVRPGEIVALAGLVGSGRSEVACSIFGVDRYDAGSVTVNGRRLRRASPTAAMAAGIGFVPEDRRQQGLVMDMSIARNVALASMRSLQRFGLISGVAERRFAADWGQRLQLKYGSLSDPATSLSGGNQQKVVLAKWLARSPALLIIDEPTRGIDVGTKAEVHRLLGELASEGVAVLMISSELPEVLRVADRILVMREGSVVTELSRDQATEEAIVAAATGQAEAAA
jgi:rhamnose transport system ATP-binding protein